MNKICFHGTLIVWQLIFLFAVAGANPVSAQVSANGKDASRDADPAEIELLLSDDLYFVLVKSEANSSMPSLSDLQNRNYIEMLDLTDYQQKKIRNSQKEFEVLLKDVMSALASGQKSDLNSESLKEKTKEIKEELSKLLSYQQRNLLKLLTERNAIVCSGVEGYVEVRKLILNDNAKRILEELRSEYLKKTLAEVSMYFDQVLKVLSEDQAKKLVAICGEVPEEFVVGSLELLVWQNQSARNKLAPSKFKDVKPKFLGKFLELEQQRLRVALSGNLVVNQAKKSPIALSLLRIVNSKRYGPLEVIAGAQMNFMNANDEESEEKRNSLREKSRELMNQMATGAKSRDEAMKEILGLQDELVIWQVERFVEGLLPFQKEELESVIIRRSISSNGLIATLLNHEKKFSITSEQKKKLEKLQLDVCKRQRSLSRQVESDIWTRLAGQVTGLDVSKFMHGLKQNEKIAGCPSLLLRPKKQKEFLYPRQFAK